MNYITWLKKKKKKMEDLSVPKLKFQIPSKRNF